MAMIGLRYDLRAPGFSSASHAEIYAACLDQCAWGDEHGLDTVILSEHHGVDDGYLPAPVTMGAAIAGRTNRIGINIAAILVPLPVAQVGQGERRKRQRLRGVPNDAVGAHVVHHCFARVVADEEPDHAPPL